MKTQIQLVFLLVVSASANDWPQAAGPNGDFSVKGNAPPEFSVTHGRNVLWRKKLPSTGQGTPIVSNGRVFVTSHEPIVADTQYGSNIVGICFDAGTGKELWRRTLPGVRNTDLSSLFSDNTAASPVADEKRVCFVNVGGSLKCFDFEGREQWSYDWVPFGRHHARLHEPILHGGNVITVQYRHRDLKPIHTTKPGSKPLGRDRKFWTHLQAFNLKTGKREWIAETGTSIHQTSLIGKTHKGVAAILTGRGGGHQPPEEPYGMSLVNAANGATIWDLAIAGYPSAQNACWDGRHAYGFAKDEHVTVDVETGKVVRRVSLTEAVTITSQRDGRYVTERNTNLKKARRVITKNTNVRVGRYHYFRSDSGFLIGRVHLDKGTVEYLQVPAQVVRRKGEKDEVLWTQALKNDMKTANGFVATQDKRNAGNGWGHVSAASGTVIGDKLYLPTMIGMVYVIDWDAKLLDENALLSVSDLGPATETWSLSSLSFSDGKIYARTLKELICIGDE
ncbi:MAG: PQQ-binding-like beta-propeller repeat protein [Limisphaerales bacterium]